MMNKKILNLILEARGNKGLTMFDIDDTMFTSNASVLVVNKKTGKKKELNPQEFNHYKLQSGEEYDFGQFKSSKLFYNTATPIGKMISKFKAILKNNFDEYSVQTVGSTAFFSGHN